MPNRLTFFAALAISLLAVSSVVRAQPPWTVNQPIASTEKELYIEHVPDSHVAVWAEQYNAGPESQRIELFGEQALDDQLTNNFIRYSGDNGATWSTPQPLPNSDLYYGGTRVYEGPTGATMLYDPRAGVLVQPWLRQVFGSSGTFYNHTYYRLSTDFGHTWLTPKLLKYETGPDFNPSNPLSSSYLNTNNAYVGQNMVMTAGGELVMGVGGAKAPAGGPSPGGELFAALNFTGTWNGLTGAAADYTWQAGNRVTISSSISSRGLQETGVAQLADGRILDVWRGSNAGLGSVAGRKWFSLANSHGQSLSTVQELKYDDGTSFYSPSSLSRLVRHAGSGKLYWIGNISSSNPSGNSPRHPLVIAEVDETLVAIRRDTVTLIADQQAGELSTVQYSNFSILEDPATHQLVLFITNYGAKSNSFDADSFKLTLTFLADTLSDLDRDGNVDLDDYSVLRSHWLESVAPWSPKGDLTGDGFIDVLDFAVFKKDYIAANGGNGSELPAVPEPSAIALAAAALSSWLVVVVGRALRRDLGEKGSQTGHYSLLLYKLIPSVRNNASYHFRAWHANELHPRRLFCASKASSQG